MTTEVTTENFSINFETNFTDFTGFNGPKNAVERHLRDYVNSPEAWNDACTPRHLRHLDCVSVRKRDDPKADKFHSDEVDTYTMTLSPATKFDERELEAGDIESRDYWKRLKSRHMDYKERTSYDDRQQQQQDERYKWTVIESISDMLELNKRRRVALHNAVNSLDLQKGGRPLPVVIFAAAAWILENDPVNEARHWNPEMDVSERDEVFVNVCDEIVDDYKMYTVNSVEKAYRYIEDNIGKLTDSEGRINLFGGDIPDNPSTRNQITDGNDCGFGDIERKFVAYDASEGMTYIPPDTG